MPRNRLLAILMSLIMASSVFSQTPSAGWQATLNGVSHDVAGTVSIVDADTILVENFIYDGGGLGVYFYLAESEATLSSGLQIGPNLLGTVYDGDEGSFTIDLPTGSTIDGYHAVSVWCVPADASFGSGTFAVVPEPNTLATLGFGTAIMLGLFRRKVRK